MKPEMMKLSVFLFIIVLTSATVTVYALSQEDAARVDFLSQKGTQLADQDSLTAAAAKFQAALEINLKRAPSYVGLGNIRLKLGDLKGAEQAFRKALRCRGDYAPALNGLGNVFLRTKNELQWAVKYFKLACQAESKYADAYYNLAIAYRKMGDTREIDAYKRLVKAIPAHQDGWFQIGRIFQKGESGQSVNRDRAELAYRRQIKVNPNHSQALVHLGEVLKQLNKTEEAVNVLTPIVEDASNPFQYFALEELAKVHKERREYDRSEALFAAYIEALSPEEQAMFYDLGLVAKGDELDRFIHAPREQWKTLSAAFWAGRDPAPVTAANERWVEHCRRVAYARKHFGEHKFPWDARGEMYIRYGRPDHISSSRNIRFETDRGVLALKDRLMNQAGGALQHLLLSRRMVNYYRDSQRGSVQKGLDDQQTLSTILGFPVYPVPARGVWEYWIYTNVGGGVEVTFVQERTPGPYKYAEMPHSGDRVWVDEITGRDPKTEPGIHIFDVLREKQPRIDIQFGSNLTWQRMNPGIVMHRVSRETPQIYEQDFATTPLDFYYDSARFKSDDRSVKLEVYYGIPTRDLTYIEGADGRLTAYLKRGVALYDEDNKPVYRSGEEMELYTLEPVDTTQIAFVPEMDRLSVSPGTYRLSVQILDTSSGKSQVYNSEVVLSPFGEDSLRISDIELAALIRPSRGSKFTKGNIEVVPNPSLFYLAGQPVYLYYEVYNLKKDEFGRTKYRVSYELRSLQKGNLAVRILKALGRLVGIERRAEVVTMEYEHEGNKADEYGYLQLDMSNTERGNQMFVIEVVDENEGSRAKSAVSFGIR